MLPHKVCSSWRPKPRSSPWQLAPQTASRNPFLSLSPSSFLWSFPLVSYNWAINSQLVRTTTRTNLVRTTTRTNFLTSGNYNSLNKDRRHSISKMTLGKSSLNVTPSLTHLSERDSSPFPAWLDNQASSTCRYYDFMGKILFPVHKTSVITVAEKPSPQKRKELLAGVLGRVISLYRKRRRDLEDTSESPFFRNC